MSDINERLTTIESKLDKQQEMLNRIFQVLDAAFSRFGDVLKSPFLQTIFSNMAPKNKEIPANTTDSTP